MVKHECRHEDSSNDDPIFKRPSPRLTANILGIDGIESFPPAKEKEIINKFGKHDLSKLSAKHKANFQVFESMEFKNDTFKGHNITDSDIKNAMAAASTPKLTEDEYNFTAVKYLLHDIKRTQRKVFLKNNEEDMEDLYELNYIKDHPSYSDLDLQEKTVVTQ